MADHNVQLNYTPNSFAPAINPIAVRPGDTIRFHLGSGPTNGKIRITFHSPQFFSAPQFHDGDGAIQVVRNVNTTTYHCELLVNGQVFAQSRENAGGEIVPGMDG